MDIKLGKVFSYGERLPLLKSHDLTLVTWQTDKILSLVLHDLWPLILAECWLLGEDSERKRLSRHQLFVCSSFNRQKSLKEIKSIYFMFELILIYVLIEKVRKNITFHGKLSWTEFSSIS